MDKYTKKDIIESVNTFLNRILITHRSTGEIYHTIQSPNSNKIAELINKEFKLPKKYSSKRI